jgi:hypothetical protein
MSPSPSIDCSLSEIIFDDIDNDAVGCQGRTCQGRTIATSKYAPPSQLAFQHYRKS